MDKGETRDRGRESGHSVLGRLGEAGSEAVTEALQGFMDEAREAVGADLCVANLVSGGSQNPGAWSGKMPADLVGAGQSPRESAMCRLVMETGTPLVVEDLRADVRFREGYLSADYRFRSYAGTPLVGSDGHVVGCLCMLASEPASFGAGDLALLEAFGRAAVTRLQLLGALAGRRVKAEPNPVRTQASDSMLGASLDMVCAVGLDGTITAANRVSPYVLGYDPEDLVGRDFADLAHPNDRDHVEAMFSTAAVGQAPSGARSRFMHHDGRVVHAEWSAALFAKDRIVRCVLREVGDEGDVRGGRPVSVDGGIFGLDRRGKVTFVDEVTEKLTGWGAGDLVGRRMHEVIHHKKPTGTPYPTEKCPIYGPLEDGNTHRGSGEVFWRQNGTSFPMENVSTPIHEGSDVVGAVVFFEDAAERLRAEEELRRQETRNRTVLEATPDLMILYRRDGEYIDVLANDAGKLYLPKEELIGRNVNDVLPPHVEEGLLRNTALALDTGETQDYEYALDVPEGSLTFEARIVASGADEVLCVVRDVTGRRRTEEELRGAHQRLASRFENSPLGIIEWGSNAEVVRWSGEAEKMFGCRQARAWRAPICVNLSARQFEHPGLVGNVARILQETGLNPHHLTLEITESALMDDARSSVRTLEELKPLGVSLAIDDFGTGYSSLGYLKRFPVDFLKIDRSFVDGLGKDDNGTVLVSGMVGLALGLKVVAEGVETTEQLARLREMGCDVAQGYLISKPVPADIASTFLRL